MDEVAEVVEMATESNVHENVLFIVILVLVAVVFVLENIKKFKEILGLRNKWEIQDEEQGKQISILKDKLNTIQVEVDDLKSYSKEARKQRIEYENRITSTLSEIRQEMIDNKIERMRSEILDFSSGLKTRNYNQESYTNIFNIYSKYEKLIKDNNLVNGYVEVSMEYIRKRYAQQLENGFTDINE